MRLSLTPAQIAAIYDAGRSRGSDEATAADWGERPSGRRLDGLEAILVWEHGGQCDDMEYEQRKAWWTAFVRHMDGEQQ